MDIKSKSQMRRLKVQKPEVAEWLRREIENEAYERAAKLVEDRKGAAWLRVAEEIRKLKGE